VRDTSAKPFGLPVSDLEAIVSQVGPNLDWFRGKRIFFTGGTGFVGKWLVGSLLYGNDRLGLDCRLTLLTRSPDRFLAAHPNLEFRTDVVLQRGDVVALEASSGRFDVLVHGAADVVAGRTNFDVFVEAVQGAQRTLDFAVKSGCLRYLLISSGAVYGRQRPEVGAVTEFDPSYLSTADPRSAYGEGKRSAELLSTLFADQFGIEVVIARLFAFVGPHLALDGPFAIGNFVRDTLKGGPLTISGDGTPMRSYLYASDMAVWLLSILSKGTAGAIYNVGGTETIAIRELAELVRDTLGSSCRIAVSGQSLRGTVRADARVEKVPERYVPDTSFAKQALGLTTTVSLTEGIRRYADWVLINEASGLGASTDLSPS
jgi:nucleoside-diphosphate-sugar epimerase